MADEPAGEMGKTLLINPSSSKNTIIEITVVKTVTRESTATQCDSHLIMLRFPSGVGKKIGITISLLRLLLLLLWLLSLSSSFYCGLNALSYVSQHAS